MPDLHQPGLPAELSDPVCEAYNARLGLWLFAVYLVAFAGFVIINAAWPQWMDEVIVAGLNLAVLYGVGLIVGAFVLALFYAWCCKTPRQEGA